MATESDVTVIGGGWSGLLACKYMLDNGLTPIVLESRSAVGGVWRYSDDPQLTTVMRSTRTTSSRGITEIADFPMPDDYPDFPSHLQVIDYLDQYVEKFNLADHIRCNTHVESVGKVDGRWHIVDRHGVEYVSKFLIICSGLHSKPNVDAVATVFNNFSGEISHSEQYKHPTESHAGKNILIFGGGETSSDIADELSQVARRVHYSISNGAWFFRRTFSDNKGADVMDSWSSPLRTIASPTERGALFPQLLLTLLFGKQGHGQAVWRSPAKFYGQFFNKSGEVLRAVKQGLIQPHSKVVECAGKKITFADGAATEIDQVILCTGYHRNFKFLPDYDTSIYHHYLFVFNNDDPSLALLGFARPVVTSIPFMTEQQVRLVANVFAGRLQLPDKDVRTQEIATDAATMAARYSDTSGRADGLVDPMWYTRR
ncbi:MAG: dimethylaniline monooxygenase (N-oxide forming), partial [Gammaproteobacteria bacterium]